MNSLFDIIAREVRKDGIIPFARFMELALYCPVYGYYEKEKDTVGRRGDFFTSVSVGSLFGELLAFQFAEWLRPEAGNRKSEVRIVEAGAHDGQLAKDILVWLRERRAELFRNIEYCIVEPSVRRRKWQEKVLADFGGKICWAAQLSDLTKCPQLPSRSSTRRKQVSATPIHRERAKEAGVRNPEGVRGIIFCNELLDALPVRRLGWDAKNKWWFEWGVALKDGQFVWAKIQHPASRITLPVLPEALLDVLPDGFNTEICPAADQWWREAAGVLRCGKLLTIDYGLTTEGFFMPERSEGTLRAYYRHRLSKDLLANAGAQDLTAHVHFTALQAVGESARLKTEQFTTQAQFLTEIAGRIWRSRADFGEWTSARARQFQTLTHPEHLGRSFRVLLQSARLTTPHD